MDISQHIRSRLCDMGADLVGFADLQPAAAADRDNYPRAVAIAVGLSPFALHEVEDGPTEAYHAEYTRANELLDSLSRETASFLSELGYRAKAFAATDEGVDAETLSTRLPHKTVATLAGIGWIGKCALLVTEQFGSALRLTKVLTDASISCDSPVTESRCGECRDCVDICPGRAPSGANWTQGLPRDSFFDAYLCRKTARENALRRTGRRGTFCGMCVAVCPWTKRYLNQTRKGN